jgi:hypothetical protein
MIKEQIQKTLSEEEQRQYRFKMYTKDGKERIVNVYDAKDEEHAKKIAATTFGVSFENPNADSSDEEKLKLGKMLVRLRGPEGFAKNYHMTDFDEFFRVVKSIEKLPQSEDELYDAYMFAKRNQK